MKIFKEELTKKIQQSSKNNFGIENFDEYRYGEYSPPSEINKSFIELVKYVVKKIINHEKSRIKKLEITLINRYGNDLEKIFSNLNSESQNLLVELIAYRLLGNKKVKLERNNNEYWQAIALAKSLADPNDRYDRKFMHFIFEKFNLKLAGYDLQLYFSTIGIAIDFIIEQYAFKINNKNIVFVEKGDIVLDVGGCWGDTALYFAHQTGEQGKVYSFEFIPDNISFFNVNTSLNPNFKSTIKLIENPVSDNTGDIIYFKDNGPGSKIEFEPFDGQTGFSTTVSIDDFVRSNNIERIDFIKMDIEGAEPVALKGAIETIKKHRPKLAIAIYHTMADFVNIPNWILDLNLDYEIFIGHYTIHAEETVCFAKPRSK
jgi:FkbM family methyltransferase